MRAIISEWVDPIIERVHENLHILLIVWNALWILVLVARLSPIAKTGQVMALAGYLHTVIWAVNCQR